MKYTVDVPAKTGCTHFAIKTPTGEVVMTPTAAELKANNMGNGDPFLRLLQYCVRKNNASTNAQIRTAIQGDDL